MNSLDDETASVLATLFRAVHVWHNGYMKDSACFQRSNASPAPWSRYMHQATTLFDSLARRAKTALACDHIPDGLVVNIVRGASSAASTAQCLELKDQARVASFVRATTECCQVSIYLCIQQTTIASSNASFAFLEGIQPHIWRIMAVMEPYLFWDPRPFWTGTTKVTIDVGIWKLYVRLFLLAGFDLQRRLRQRQIQRLAEKTKESQYRENDRDEAAPPTEDDNVGFDPTTQRRPFRCPADVGFGTTIDDECDERDAESWPMSILFSAIDILADEWNHASYTSANVRLVARCFMRYATIGFIRTSPQHQQQASKQGTFYVHNMPEYTVQGVGHAQGWLGVDHDAFYGKGGAVLRDILADLALVTHIDAWLRAITYAKPEEAAPLIQREPLGKRLYDALCDVESSILSRDFDVLMPHCRDAQMMDDNHEESWASRSMHDSLPWARKLGGLAFDGIQRFLDMDEAVEAERIFQRSGMAHIIAPGEVWQFTRRWPDMKATPINVINGLRSRDMTLYQDHIRTPRATEVARQRGKDLPRCLLPLLDHLVWEAARHIFRTSIINKESSEAFPSFLMESHHLRSVLNHSTSVPAKVAPAFWNRFLVWTRLCRRAGEEAERSHFTDAHHTWNYTMNKLAMVIRGGAGMSEDTILTGSFPPFPQILLLRGRILLWNPLAKPLVYRPTEVVRQPPQQQQRNVATGSSPNRLVDSDGDDVMEWEEEELIDDEVGGVPVDPDEQIIEQTLERMRGLRPWMATPIVDVSTDSPTLIWILWMFSRVILLQCLLRRMRGPLARGYQIGEARVHMYGSMLASVLRPNEDGGEKDL